MVLRLSETLALPLRERNRLLEAAGLAPAYPEGALDSAALAPFRTALVTLLSAHEPYPALIVDGRFTVVDANEAASALFGPDLIGGNLVRRFVDEAAREAIVNWPDVARAGLARLRDRARQAPHDAALAELLAVAESTVPPGEPIVDDLIVCPEFVADGEVIRTVGMAARFDSALDVTLEELRIELLYPADAVAEAFFKRGVRGSR
jgi:MmyB-like transcription regulator ligand binding domain